MSAYTQHDTAALETELAEPTPAPAALLAAIQSGDADAARALWDRMCDWQRRRDAYHTAQDWLMGACCRYQRSGTDEDRAAIEDARIDRNLTSNAFFLRDDSLMALLCAWERCSGLPFPGVVDPGSSQGAYLTLERDDKRDLLIVRRVPPWDTKQEARS